MIVRLFTTVALVVFSILGATIAQAQDSAAFNAKQVEAIEKIVQDYIMAHPEIIPQAIGALQEKERASQEAEGQRYLNEKYAEIAKSPNDPVLGNPEGDVTIVEFIDYNCGYCKAVHAIVRDLVKADGNIRLVYKEFPILSETSVTAAQAALAAHAQGKYAEFQDALMKNRGPLTEESIFKIAEQLGLDSERMKKDMASPEIAAILEKNQQQAKNLGIRGTPSFAVGSRLIFGAVDKNTLKQLVEVARRPLTKEKALSRDRN